MNKDKKIPLEITSNTREVIQRFNLDPKKMKFWREGYTAHAKYTVGFMNSYNATADIEEGATNAMLMFELCDEIVNKMR